MLHRALRDLELHGKKKTKQCRKWLATSARLAYWQATQDEESDLARNPEEPRYLLISMHRISLNITQSFFSGPEHATLRGG